jgi:tetratricopeptide (TPR) repeat protein
MKLRNLFFLLCSSSLLVFSSCGNDATKTNVDSTAGKDSLVIVNDQIRKDPGNLDLYLRRSKIYMQKNDYAASLMDIERVLAIDSSNPNYLIAAADIYFFTGRFTRAKEVLDRAVKENPDNIDSKLRLAQLHHFLTNFEEEIALLDQVLKIDVHNAQAYFMKGMMFKEQGDTAKAISSMQTAVEQDPDHYNAYIQLGLLCAATDNPLAESYYLNAIKINPSSEEAMYNLGMYYQELDNYNAAIETYTTLLKANPHHFDAHFNLGMLHVVKLNMVDEAMKLFNAAIADDPQDPRGYYGRGYCFEKKGDVNNAITDYKMALQVDPTYDNAAISLERLEK